jgi:hypothetical protein
MNKLANLYSEVYAARVARDAVKGTPGFWIANARVAAAFAAVRACSGFAS